MNEKIITLEHLKRIKEYIKDKLTGKADAEHTHASATSSAAGFMSAEDKMKLDNIGSGDEYFKYKELSLRCYSDNNANLLFPIIIGVENHYEQTRMFFPVAVMFGNSSQVTLPADSKTVFKYEHSSSALGQMTVKKTSKIIIGEQEADVRLNLGMYHFEGNDYYSPYGSMTIITGNQDLVVPGFGTTGRVFYAL